LRLSIALVYRFAFFTGGEIQDPASVKVVNHMINDLPSKHHDGLNFLREPIHIDIAMAFG
jgi:hypothetical protein